MSNAPPPPIHRKSNVAAGAISQATANTVPMDNGLMDEPWILWLIAVPLLWIGMDRIGYWSGEDRQIPAVGGPPSIEVQIRAKVNMYTSYAQEAGTIEELNDVTDALDVLSDELDRLQSGSLTTDEYVAGLAAQNEIESAHTEIRQLKCKSDILEQHVDNVISQEKSAWVDLDENTLSKEELEGFFEIFERAFLLTAKDMGCPTADTLAAFIARFKVHLYSVSPKGKTPKKGPKNTKTKLFAGAAKVAVSGVVFEVARKVGDKILNKVLNPLLDPLLDSWEHKILEYWKKQDVKGNDVIDNNIKKESPEVSKEISADSSVPKNDSENKAQPALPPKQQPEKHVKTAPRKDKNKAPVLLKKNVQKKPVGSQKKSVQDKDKLGSA